MIANKKNKLKPGDVVEYVGKSSSPHMKAIGSVGVLISQWDYEPTKGEHFHVVWMSRTCPRWTQTEPYESVFWENVRKIGEVDLDHFLAREVSHGE